MQHPPDPERRKLQRATQTLQADAWYPHSTHRVQYQRSAPRQLIWGGDAGRHTREGDYLKVRLAAFTTSANDLMSASIRFLKSLPVGPAGLTAIFCRPSWTAGAASASANSVVNLSTIGPGVPTGKKNPLQSWVSTSGNPDSAILGTSVSSDERSEPVTARARILPALTNGMAGGPSEIVNRLCPETTLRFDSLLLI